VVFAPLPHFGTLAGCRAAPICLGLCALFGTFAGGYVPSLWGGSGFSLSSVLFAVGGGIAGVWLGVRLSA
jgi:outer membrane lipoprotein SlyB